MDILLTPDYLSASVIGTSGNASVISRIGLETRKYAWVEDYLRDVNIRAEISKAQDEIKEARSSLIHKDELRAQFKASCKKLNEFRVKQIRALLGEIQAGSPIPFSVLQIGAGRKILGAPVLPWFINFSEEELDTIFSALPEGIREKDRQSMIAKCQQTIVDLEKTIETELSPQSRWFFKENGQPEIFPRGCRWTIFVETWKRVAARFVGRVDVEGTKLKTDAEHWAFSKLGLDLVRKVTPLKEPRE